MTYRFTHNGTEHEIPSFRELPAGALRKARRGADEMDKAFTILEETLGLDNPALAAVDSMTIEQFGEWLTGWTKGAALGESSSSSS